MTKDELLAKKTDLEKQIKGFTDKQPLAVHEQGQLEKLKEDLKAVETEIADQP